MATTFIVEVQRPEEAIVRLFRWARERGLLIEGNDSSGHFAQTRTGFSGVPKGGLQGNYFVSGPYVILSTNRELPIEVFSESLEKHGLQLTGAR